MKTHRPGIFFAFVSVVAMTASMLVGTNIASADQVQVQSYQRASQTAACAAQPGETPWQASWGPDSSWTPSYEMWANNGTGGWVCTRSITWARSESSPRSYALGDIGPGGGLVFLISGGLTYEMAPKNWNDPTNASATDPALTWCDSRVNISATFGTAVGTGAANTAAMAASVACSSNAAAAVLAYAPAGTTAGQWFLPSFDELNAMCNYSRNPSAPAAPSVNCYGTSGTSQNGAFASSNYGFSSPYGYYWSSSQASENTAWARTFVNGQFIEGYKNNDPTLVVVRPIRAF